MTKKPSRLERQLKYNAESLENIAYFQMNPTTARSKQSYKTFRKELLGERKRLVRK
jgi:hypothetical protein